MKYFIITVDTEGDNLWRYHDGDIITTRNSLYIPAFQNLCEEYAFKPVYLVNYEMANDDVFVESANLWQNGGKCEVGIHVHAWNNPPLVDLRRKFKGQPYLIEYSHDEMRQKFYILFELLTKKFGKSPLSHRAGRWAMNSFYFQILKEYGIKTDCSVTPFIDWSTAKGGIGGGSDYSSADIAPHFINGVYEVPMTIRRLTSSRKKKLLGLFQFEKAVTSHVWLRPALCSFENMKALVDAVDAESDTDYLEFMVHSSELMPGGSPYTKNEKRSALFNDRVKKIFDYIASLGYEGVTLNEYYSIKNGEN